jgi:hypothetical protein
MSALEQLPTFDPPSAADGAHTLSAFLYRFGFPVLAGVVMLGLTVYFAVKLPPLFTAELQAQTEKAATIERMLQDHVDEMRARDSEHRQYERSSLQLLSLTCVSMAHGNRALEQACRAEAPR